MFTQSYVDSWCLFPAGNPPPLWLIYDTFMGNLHSGSINLMSHLIMLHLRKEIAEPKRIQLYLGRVWGDKGVGIPSRGEGAQLEKNTHQPNWKNAIIIIWTRIYLNCIFNAKVFLSGGHLVFHLLFFKNKPCITWNTSTI